LDVYAKCKNKLTKNIRVFPDMDYFKEVCFIPGDGYYFGSKGDSFTNYSFLSTVNITKQELDENFEILFETGCLNTCVRNDIPCMNLETGDTTHSHRTKKSFHYCRLHWEVGRGACSQFK
jgi:hypothetical protein